MKNTLKKNTTIGLSRKQLVRAADLLREEQAVFVRIQGVHPGLLMNSAKNLLTQARSRKKSEIPEIEEDAESRAYRMRNKTLYIPENAIRGALTNSSAVYRIQRKSAAQLISGTVRIWPEEISLGTKNYQIDLRPVVVQRSRIVRARPWLPKWEASFYIIYDSTYGIEQKLLRRIFTEAGKRIGILDFRPQHRGQFGRFVVKTWNPVK